MVLSVRSAVNADEQEERLVPRPSQATFKPLNQANNPPKMGEAEQLHSRLVICGLDNAQDYDVAILPTLCRPTFHIYPPPPFHQINFASSNCR